jgi:hypothetical protein
MTTTAAARVIGKCRNGHAVNGTDDMVRAGWITCPCGSPAVAKFMTISLKPETKCGARCTSSLGPVCNCSCSGEAHGSDHRA